MITDAQLTFAESLDIGDNTAGNHLSTNSYDTGPLYSGNVGAMDWGVGDPLYFYFLVTEAFASANDPTINIRLISSAASALTTPTTHIETTYQKADLALGTYKFFPLIGGQTWLRYVGANGFVTADTSNFTAGMLTLGITRDQSYIKNYATNWSLT